jgi:DNA helicase-2/ATP-dependent DNA helicase PcrA
VPRLLPGPARRERGRVECALLKTAEDEAERIAARIAHLRALPADTAPDGEPWAEDRPEGLRFSDIAVLARKRSQFPPIRRALEARGIPVEVVGLGGLLTVPEVQDVVATLKVMHDPTAGASLARLLTGPRWRIGPRDLVALGRRARALAKEVARDLTGPRSRDKDGRGGEGQGGVPAQGHDGEQGSGAHPPHGDGTAGPDPLRQLVSELSEESGSLVDALDDLGMPEDYTPEGFRRLRRLRDEFRTLRGQVGLPLPDLVAEVERTLGLDIEVAARPGLDPVTARADLDAFTDAAARFAGDAEDSTLGAFLAFLKAAESEEFGLEAGRVGETDSVKLLTVHASKGLEWPVVVVPGLSFAGQ